MAHDNISIAETYKVAKEKAVVVIEEDFSIGEKINKLNRQRFSDIYKSEIIMPLIYGEPIKTPKIGQILTINNFFRSPYCFQLGEHAHSGSVNKPTWCNRNYGPFSRIKNYQSAIILPLLVELDKEYIKNSLQVLTRINARPLGIIRYNKYNLSDLAGSEFNPNRDEMLSLVNEKRNRMFLYQIDDVNAYSQLDEEFDISNISRSISKVNIDLINTAGEVFKSYSVNNQGKRSCKSHTRCTQEELKIFDFDVNNFAPSMNTRTGMKSTYPKTYSSAQNGISLYARNGGITSIYFAKTFFVLLDLPPESRNDLSRIEIYYTSRT